MSSDPPGDARSPQARPAATPELDLAALLRIRGAPLVEGLERHLPGGREHAEGTASYAFATAVGLGFERNQAEVAREMAMLHEVGLIYVPAAIATKPAAERTAEEAEQFDGHYEAGYRLALGAGVPEYACAWMLRLRERFDGGGPEALQGEAIPIEARLIRAACACQTALTVTGGERGEPLRAAIELLARQAGGELDPRVVAALTAMLQRAAS
jgi:HD-GYP domain-containing protein (c-di-GMP phosphodiesterase class II)